MTKHQRQDSTTDQLNDVAANLKADRDDLADWILDEGKPPSKGDMGQAYRMAVNLGCYDAADWIRRRAER
jgi:hypothetical protein